MKKKLVLVLTTTATLTISGLAMFLAPKFSGLNANADPVTYSISLDSDVELVDKDKGYLYQANVKNNKFDVIGYGANAEGFCTIAKKTHTSTASNTFTFEGMVYNRSVINGFKTLKAKFSGGDLYYKFTDFLMEDMDFAGETNTLTSNVAVNVPEGKAYFVVFNKSTTPVAIESLEVEYACDGSVDDSMIYDKTTSLGGARSVSKRVTKEDSFLELENNPTYNTNNHSTGYDTDPKEAHEEHPEEAHPDAWFRWNGKYFTNSGALGTDFKFGMTIVGNISQVLDETDYFHYAVWPQFTYAGDTEEPWVQTYIGNDNYEPLGKDGALHADDPYVNESYTGRFFTNYGYYGGHWVFADPDNELIADGTKTFRKAYEEHPLPYWYLEFHVYLNSDEGNDAWCDIKINGTLIYSSYIFENYDTVNKPSISIKTLPMHVVNFGQDDSEYPRDSYVGTFTYPRIIS